MIKKITYSYDVLSEKNIFQIKETFADHRLYTIYHDTDTYGFGFFVVFSYYDEEDVTFDLDKTKQDMIEYSMDIHFQKLEKERQIYETHKKHFNSLFSNEIRKINNDTTNIIFLCEL